MKMNFQGRIKTLINFAVEVTSSFYLMANFELTEMLQRFHMSGARGKRKNTVIRTFTVLGSLNY